MHTIKASLLLWIGKSKEFSLYLELTANWDRGCYSKSVCSGWDSF